MSIPAISRGASAQPITEGPQEKRQIEVEKKTRLLWVLAAFACVPVVVAWFRATELNGHWTHALIATLAFALGTIAGLALTLVGSLASISAWRLTARIADQQDEVMDNMRGDVNSHGFALGRLETAVEKLESNLKVQTEEIQRGRETIRTERRVRSFFRIRSLPNNEVNEIDMFRLEKRIDGHPVSFTPVTEDYCVGVLERYLNYCRQSADIQFNVRKRAYAQELAGQENGIAIYFDLAECYSMEGISEGGLPLWIQRDEGQSAVFLCEGFQGIQKEILTDEEPSYRAAIGRFRHAGRHVFVVAGLSQPGTLAAGEFLESLFKEEVESAAKTLHINSQIYGVLSGIPHGQDPDGQPAEQDFFCVVKGTVRSEPDFAVMGLQVDALYYSDDGVNWRREL